MELVEQALQSALPSGWRVHSRREVRVETPRGIVRPDLIVAITAPDGTGSEVLIEVKRTAVPRDVANVAARLNALAYPAGGRMLVAEFVSPATRAYLDQVGMGWFDPTGNMRLRLDKPAVFIDRAGADRGGTRDPAERLLKSLRGSAAAKVVLELLETALPVGVRELAGRARVGPATSARVLELLDRDAAIVRSDDGSVTTVRKRALVDRWTADYSVMKHNEVMTTLDPRGVSHAMNALSTAKARITVTGSAAARAYLPEGVTPVSPLVSLSLYAEDPMGLLRQLGLKKVERGMNVLVMQPYDEVVHAKARLVGGLRCAAPAQVVADLLTGPGRSGEEAEQLMAALAVTDPGWLS
ncbi:type IV toxin-antitoxin system AbiEi family antitoxin [Saccharothrix deserti]|uniref:type IV toxin-antitoxin system AbiEi family antitoxin n=1 Tax=Saccharothrix deserti TaxID=2593674 RepID=UPI00131CFF60|nr:type IV toxin-antitoxin system AbiEi family antitoxin [Saccharothrix deserti]